MNTFQRRQQLGIGNIFSTSTGLIPRKLLRIDHGLLRDARKKNTYLQVKTGRIEKIQSNIWCTFNPSKPAGRYLHN